MKVLVTGSIKYTKEQLEKLQEIGLEIIYIQDERNKIELDVSEIEYVICNGLFLYNDIKEFKNLKYIQVTSAGLDRLPMEYIQENKIEVFNARGVYSIPIAEWTVLKILEVYKKSKIFYNQQKEHIWEKQRDIIEHNGRTACIIGYGSIGSEIAKRLKVFGVKIKVVDIQQPESDIIDEYYSFEQIDKAIIASDIIILSLPLTEQTQNSINKNKLEIMKQDAVLVNISRGKIINEKDLIEQLENKKFKGVILDVLAEEPLDKSSKLWDYDNTIITPHNCFVSDRNNERMFNVILENINKVKEG